MDNSNFTFTQTFFKTSGHSSGNQPNRHWIKLRNTVAAKFGKQLPTNWAGDTLKCTITGTIVNQEIDDGGRKTLTMHGTFIAHGEHAVVLDRVTIVFVPTVNKRGSPTFNFITLWASKHEIFKHFHLGNFSTDESESLVEWHRVAMKMNRG